MRYCKSLLYGGMLVDAQSADYSDYARLLLRCPVCGNAVHLVGTKHRQEYSRLAPKSRQIVIVKPHDVPAYWSHFNGIESESCELRVQQIEEQDIERIATKARNQRLKLFQRRFWQIIQESHTFDPEDQIRELVLRLIRLASPEHARVYSVEAMLARLQEIFRIKFRESDPTILKETATNLLRDAKNSPREMIAAATSDDFVALLDWLSILELDLHLAIVHEAIDFLRTKSAVPLLDFLFLYGIQAWHHNEVVVRQIKTEEEFAQAFKVDENQQWEVGAIVTRVLGNAIGVLAITRWADGLQQYTSDFQRSF